MMRPHTIGRLQLRLSSSARLVPALPAACSDWFHQRLRRELGLLLERLDDGSGLCIGQLELDLGSLPASNWEEVLQQRLLAALQKALLEYCRPHVIGASSLRQTANDDDMNGADPSVPDAEKALQTPEATSPSLPMLRRYLLSGYTEPALRKLFHDDGTIPWLRQQLLQTPQLCAVLWQECIQRQPAAERLQHLLGELETEWRDSMATPGDHALTYRLLTGKSQGVWCGRSGAATPTPAMLQRYLLSGHASSSLRQLFHAGQAIAWLRQQLQQAPQAWHSVLRDCGHDVHSLGRLQRTFGGVGMDVIKDMDPLADAMAETYYVDNAGLILLWPLLPGLLRRWGLLEQGRFIDVEAQQQAICRLDSWIWQSTQVAEWRMVLTKLLCGWGIGQALLPFVQDETQEACWADLDALLRDLAAQTPGLQRCDQNDIRRWFLQRPGQLRRQDQRWHLQVETDASDVLLGDLPWPVSQVSLPWLTAPIEVVWV